MSVYKGTFVYKKGHQAQAHKDRALAHGFTAKMVVLNWGKLYRVEVS